MTPDLSYEREGAGASTSSKKIDLGRRGKKKIVPKHARAVPTTAKGVLKTQGARSFAARGTELSACLLVSFS